MPKTSFLAVLKKIEMLEKHQTDEQRIILILIFRNSINCHYLIMKVLNGWKNKY